MGCRRCCLRGREAAGKALLRHTREGGSGFASTVRREHSTIPLVLELLAAGEHPVGCDHPRVHVDLQQGRGKRRDAVDLAVARQHAAGPLAPPRANGGEDGGGLALGRDLHDELRRVGNGVDLVVGCEYSAVPLARLLTDVAEGLQGVRDWVDLKDRGGVVGLRELHTRDHARRRFCCSRCGAVFEWRGTHDGIDLAVASKDALDPLALHRGRDHAESTHLVRQWVDLEDALRRICHAASRQ